MKISKQDYKFVPIDPDTNFDPKYNRRVIEETINKSKVLRERKRRENLDKTRERTQAVAQYLSSLDTGKTSASVLEYFGRHEIARLRGEEIKDLIYAKIGNETKAKLEEKAIRA